jgi:uncharacterized iron-regulated protein
MKHFMIFFLCFLFYSNINYSQGNEHIYTNVIQKVINIFKEKQIVAIGENHGRFKESEFRLQLIKHPEFSKIVDVVVVEFANPLYQNIINDYINCKDVEFNTLKKVWQNTTQVSGVWDSPVYEEFFTTIREVNSKLNIENRIKVIAADPPIDWDKVNSYDDFEPFSNRGRFPISIIEKEIYNKNLKALLVFGTIHTELWGIGFTAQLEKNHPNSIAIIMPPAFNEKEMRFLETYIPKESSPQLINLEKDEIGNVKYNDLHYYARFNGKLREAGHFLLFLGFDKDSTVHIPESIKTDKIYQIERKRRLNILSRN